MILKFQTYVSMKQMKFIPYEHDGLIEHPCKNLLNYYTKLSFNIYLLYVTLKRHYVTHILYF